MSADPQAPREWTVVSRSVLAWFGTYIPIRPRQRMEGECAARLCFFLPFNPFRNGKRDPKPLNKDFPLWESCVFMYNEMHVRPPTGNLFRVIVVVAVYYVLVSSPYFRELWCHGVE